MVEQMNSENLEWFLKKYMYTFLIFGKICRLASFIHKIHHWFQTAEKTIIPSGSVVSWTTRSRSDISIADRIFIEAGGNLSNALTAIEVYIVKNGLIWNG